MQTFKIKYLLQNCYLINIYINLICAISYILRGKIIANEI